MSEEKPDPKETLDPGAGWLIRILLMSGTLGSLGVHLGLTLFCGLVWVVFEAGWKHGLLKRD